MKWKLWSELTSSDKISFLALIVSVGALAFGIAGSREDQRHRKLSVIPKIALSFADGSDDKITGIHLVNSGLGPARILNVQLYVKRRFVSEAYDDDQWRKALAEVNVAIEKPSGKEQHVRFKSFMSDVYLQAGQSLPLLFQRTDELTPETIAFLREAVNALQFGVCFCSLYDDDCWSYVSPGLDGEPCESPLARFHLLRKGPLAEELKGKRRSIERWEPR
jgi:hypothetical protein